MCEYNSVFAGYSLMITNDIPNTPVKAAVT